jgi:hypothetical protein
MVPGPFIAGALQSPRFHKQNSTADDADGEDGKQGSWQGKKESRPVPSVFSLHL